MDAADRLQLAAAAELEGVTEEIALLRLQLADLLALGEAAEPAAVRRMVEAIGRMVVIEHRISGGGGRDLSENLEGVLEAMGELMRG